MEQRGDFTPMDYTFDNGTGPVDKHSPFVRPQKAPKRTHSALESPSKGALGAFNNPNRPHLSEPRNEHFIFSAPKPLTPIPSHLQNRQVPRTPPSVIDVSSGGETPNTPAHDSDAATPDTQMANKLGRFNMDGDSQGKSPKKSRRESMGLLVKSFFASSPSPSKESRGSRKPHSTKAEHRVNKRRAKNAKVALGRGYGSDDDMQDVQVAHPNSNTLGLLPGAQQNPGFVAQAGGFFSWLEAHPNLPHVLSYWLQLALHTFFILSAFGLAYFFYSSVKADIDIEASKYEAEVLRKITLCAKDYRDNRCDPATRAPALENACGNWQACMNQDPKAVAKASVTARTFARILNAFVHEFSYKSMIFTVFLIFGAFNLSNWAFGVLRTKQSSHPHPHSQSDFYPPATPQRHPSGGYIDQGFFTPYTSLKAGGIAFGKEGLPALPPPGLLLEGVGEKGGDRDRRREGGRSRRKLFAGH